MRHSTIVKFVTIKGKSYKVIQSISGNFYIEKPFYVDYNIPNPIRFASRFGTLSAAKIPSFIEEKHFNYFLEVIESINQLPDDFIKAAKKYGFLGNFVSNLIQPIEIRDLYNNIVYSFSDIVLHNIVWLTSLEGYEYWEEIRRLLKTLEDENRLQEPDTDRPGEDRSEGDRICCKGDEFECRFSNTRSRKTIDLSSERFEDCKINIPSRRTIVL